MIRRPLRSVLLPVALLLALLAWHNRVDLQAFPAILGAYSAKEYCSCRYVVGNPAAYCTAYVEQYLPLSALVDEPSARRVTARGLGSTQSAQWLGPRQGCRLLPQAAPLP
ncbi:amidase [Pseudomonas benzenivorans]|uniref:Amidase n=1 Tax=Pseudomonas benzenivorans TaxID=556533 RepID=A0ABZ0PU19_9PSED|nr:amidase [Pseudomonas benzenivorans]WPC04226.1 amidase [Pseudomonas benzenivorans]